MKVLCLKRGLTPAVTIETKFVCLSGVCKIYNYEVSIDISVEIYR